MARIVDVTQFLARYPFKSFDRPFHFVVTDPVAKWNTGIFSLTYNEIDHRVIIGHEPIGDAVTVDIQTLTCLMMNYRRAAYLARIERLHTTQETLLTLERIIPDMEAYFGDYF